MQNFFQCMLCALYVMHIVLSEDVLYLIGSMPHLTCNAIFEEIIFKCWGLCSQ